VYSPCFLLIGGIITIIEGPRARGDLSTEIQIFKFIKMKLSSEIGLSFYKIVLCTQI
jgi:hypothetical protein